MKISKNFADESDISETFRNISEIYCYLKRFFYTKMIRSIIHIFGI